MFKFYFDACDFITLQITVNESAQRTTRNERNEGLGCPALRAKCGNSAAQTEKNAREEVFRAARKCGNSAAQTERNAREGNS